MTRCIGAIMSSTMGRTTVDNSAIRKAVAGMQPKKSRSNTKSIGIGGATFVVDFIALEDKVHP